MGEGHDTERGDGIQPKRGWLVWATVALVPALLAAGLVYTRSDSTPTVRTPEDRDPELISYPADLTIPTTGMVVSLDRPGRELPVAVGSTRTFTVSVTGSAELERVELWDGDTVVGSGDVDDGLRIVRQRMEWTAATVGARVITARVYDADGHVAISNPVWVDVDERAEVADGVVDLTDPQSAVTYVPEPTEIDQGPGSESTDPPVQGIRRFRTQAEQMTAEQIDVTVEDCVVEVTSNEPAADKTVLTLSPRVARTVAPIGVIAGGETTRFEPGFGTFSLTGAVVTDGAVRYTAPTVFGTSSDCDVPGWAGDLDVVGGRVRIPGTAAGATYLYAEVEPGDWERVPRAGFVPLSGDHYDFSAHLPPLRSGAALEAWGWGDDGLYLLGKGTYTAPDPLTEFQEVNPQFNSLNDVVAPPLLRWEYPAWDDKYPPLPEGSDNLFTSGEVIPTSNSGEFSLFPWGSHQFHLGYVGAASHLLVQVSSTPFGGPDDWSVDAYGFRCVIAPVDQVTIDFTTSGCTSQILKDVPESAPDVFDQTIDANAGAGYADVVPAGLGVWVDQLAGNWTASPADPISLGKDITAGDVDFAAPPKASSYRRYIRVVPFFGDQNLGMVSNTVDLRLDTSPPAPEGEPAYRLELDLAKAPTAPDLKYSNCWQILGWKDDAEKDYLLYVAALDKLFGDSSTTPPVLSSRARLATLWNDVLIPSFGSGPICAGCYKFGGVKASFGGVKCPTSTNFLTDPLGWTYENVLKWAVSLLEKAYNAAKDVVDFVQDTYETIKDQAKKALKSICTSDGDFCDTVNDVMDHAVDRVFPAADDAVSLISVPDLDPAAFYAELKRKAITGVVLFAQSLGIPCKEYEEAMATASDANAAADASGVADGNDDYEALSDTFEKVPKSCEEMVEAVWNKVEAEVKKAVEDALDDSAQASGFGLPDFLRFRPHPAGQPGQATISATVQPTEFSADREGVTCLATIYSSVENYATGPPEGMGNKVLIQRTGVSSPWRETAYDDTTVPLPTLPATGVGGNGDPTYSETTTSISLGSVHLEEKVPFRHGGLYASGSGTAVSWATTPWMLSPYTLLFGGEFTIRAETPCAGWVEQTYQLRSDGSAPTLLKEVRS